MSLKAARRGALFRVTTHASGNHLSKKSKLDLTLDAFLILASTEANVAGHANGQPELKGACKQAEASAFGNKCGVLFTVRIGSRCGRRPVLGVGDHRVDALWEWSKIAPVDYVQIRS